LLAVELEVVEADIEGVTDSVDVRLEVVLNVEV